MALLSPQANIPVAADSGLPYSKAEILSLIQASINTAINLILPGGAVQVFSYAGDPNGVKNAVVPSICIDTTNLGRIYSNAGTGLTGWEY